MSRIHRVTSTPFDPGSPTRQLTEAIRDEGRSMVGLGEDPGRNNRSAHIDDLRKLAGVGRVGSAGSYCAVGCSAACVRGARRSRRVLPFEPSAGAKRVVRNCGLSGRYVVSPQPWYRRGSYSGYVDADALRWALLIAWHRGGSNPRIRWQGHVELIVDYDVETDTLWTIAWNVVPTGDGLERLQALGIECHPGQAITHLRCHPGGAWRRRLFAVAGL